MVYFFPSMELLAFWRQILHCGASGSGQVFAQCWRLTWENRETSRETSMGNEGGEWAQRQPAQDHFKQSTTRLYWIADKVIVGGPAVSMRKLGPFAREGSKFGIRMLLFRQSAARMHSNSHMNPLWRRCFCVFSLLSKDVLLVSPSQNQIWLL